MTEQQRDDYEDMGFSDVHDSRYEPYVIISFLRRFNQADLQEIRRQHRLKMTMLRLQQMEKAGKP